MRNVDNRRWFVRLYHEITSPLYSSNGIESCPWVSGIIHAILSIARFIVREGRRVNLRCPDGYVSSRLEIAMAGRAR